LKLLNIGIISAIPGNIMNLRRGIEKASKFSNISTSVELIDRVPKKSFDLIFLPGVGHFGEGMARLRKSNFDEFLRHYVENGGLLIGVCLGMQLLFEGSEEAPRVLGLSLLHGEVCKLKAKRLPHMGWNTVDFYDKVFGEFSGKYFYFVHSYRVKCGDEMISGFTEYSGEKFPSVVREGNIVGFQFHPEKSHLIGLKLLGRLFEWSLYQL